MARGEPQINLRVPESLKAALDAAVAAGGRSLNAEVVRRLEQSFETAEKDTRAAEALATIIQRLEEIERQIGVNNGREAKPPGKRAAAKKGK